MLGVEITFTEWPKSTRKFLALRAFWDLEKNVLHEIRVSGTVLWSPTNANSPTYTLGKNPLYLF